MDFDPYQAWLDIPRDDQPADHYRLLGLVRFEQNPQVIASAADRVCAHLQQFAADEHAVWCRKLIDEIQVARACLLDVSSKRAYDDRLRTETSARELPLRTPPPVPGTGVASVSTPGAQSPAAQDSAARFGERQIQGAPPAPGRPASIAPGTSSTGPATAGRAVAPEPTDQRVPQPASSDSPERPAPSSSPATGQGVPFARPVGAAPQPPGAAAPMARPQPAVSSQPVATPAPPSGVPVSPSGGGSGAAVPPGAGTPSQQGPSTDPSQWIPRKRTGQVGQMVASAVAGESPGPVQKTRTARTLRRRRSLESVFTYEAVVALIVLCGFVLGLVVLILAMRFG